MVIFEYKISDYTQL